MVDLPSTRLNMPERVIHSSLFCLSYNEKRKRNVFKIFHQVDERVVLSVIGYHRQHEVLEMEFEGFADLLQCHIFGFRQVFDVLWVIWVRRQFIEAAIH